MDDQEEPSEACLAIGSKETKRSDELMMVDATEKKQEQQ
jgi:hypothetical protein